MNREQYPAVLALNGPPHSGKTSLARALTRMIPDAITVQPSLVLYSMMQQDGLAPKKTSYHDFKKIDGSRERLISASESYRLRDHYVYERQICESADYRAARVVIVDNVGHTFDEMKYYDRYAAAALLLRIDAPFQEIEPIKSRSRRMRTPWEGDSRTPVEHHTMLTAYDSLQMTLLLQWLSSPLTREEAGPYNGIKTLWTRYFAASEPTAVCYAAGIAG